MLYQSILNAKLTVRKNLGRKRCTSNRDDCKLENTVKQSWFKHLGELHKEWTEAGVSASRVTTLSTPLWHNFNFVCGNRPFVQPSWSSLGVNTCGDIYDNQGLCSFQTLRAKFCLPASAYFVFLQLRSALKAYGVPWASSISSHPMRDWIAPSAGRPSVSLIYNKISYCITKPLSIKTIWNRELSDLNLSVDWERVWSNLSLTSKIWLIVLFTSKSFIEHT